MWAHRLARRPRSLNKTPYSTAHHDSSSRHRLWYSDTLPAMIPIFLLGSAIYLGLQLTHLQLSHEKYMEEANERIKQLEAEIQTIQAKTDERTVPGKASRRWW